MSSQNIKRTLIVLILALFVVINFFLIKGGSEDTRQLYTFLTGSYLVLMYLALWGGYSLTSSTPRDEIQVRFMLVTFSLGMALFLAELPAWTKLIDYRKTFSNWGNTFLDSPRYLPDLELLGKPEPHQTVKMAFDRGNIGSMLCLPTREEEPFEMRYDHNGFRNDKDLTSAKIAVVGDSFVEGELLPAAQIMTTRLEELTQETVVNLGISGYGPHQELAVLRRYALPLQPKTVVWVFYEGNDLQDVERYPDMVSFLKSNWDAVDTLWDRSFSRNILVRLTHAVRGCVPTTKTSSARIAQATLTDTEGRKQLVYVKDGSRSASLTKQELDALKTTVGMIQEAYRVVHDKGARLVVVFAPTAFRVYNNIADFNDVGGAAAHWSLNDLPDRFRTMISSISPDIVYVDLTPRLESAAKMHKLVFLPDDIHWSSEGHRVVAEALSEALMIEPKVYAQLPSPAPDTPKNHPILSKRALMVRNLDGTIRYWSDGAKQLYGWEPQAALGMSSHQLLKTIFPVPIEVIEEQLRTSGHWTGRLIHERRDGSKVGVISHWNLQQNPQSEDRSITVIEINGPSQS